MVTLAAQEAVDRGPIPAAQFFQRLPGGGAVGAAAGAAGDLLQQLGVDRVLSPQLDGPAERVAPAVDAELPRALVLVDGRRGGAGGCD